MAWIEYNDAIVQKQSTATIIPDEPVTSSYSETAPLSSSRFDLLAEDLYKHATQRRLEPRESIPLFHLANWTDRTKGGLHDPDRVRIAKLYRDAKSVFEWGLGESTNIAREMSVPRYAGIDSDAEYVATARTKGRPWFRFYFGDVGPTGSWGSPNDMSQPKVWYNYVLSPLVSERDAFDVYFVDGLIRPLCALAALLHASKYGKGRESLVLIHDYYDPVYSKDCKGCRDFAWQRIFHRLKEVADMVHHNHGEIATFQRKVDVTDEQIWELFDELKEGRLTGVWWSP